MIFGDVWMILEMIGFSEMIFGGCLDDLVGEVNHAVHFFWVIWGRLALMI